MTDDELQDWMRDELFWDPKVDSAAIAVSANAGEVTLRGTVASFRQKREAQKAAERVYGVTSVRTSSMCGSLTSTVGRTPTCAAPCCRPWRWTASSPRRSMPRPTAAW